jgi:hypothetical protein
LGAVATLQIHRGLIVDRKNPSAREELELPA